jgi:2-amino-4-hydroxy-6-hydroxymethyldihydropteridine diphosphokinase
MIVIGLGGNIGSESEIIERFVRAREALAHLGPVRSAALYRTAPIGPEQAAFLNTAVAIDVRDIQPSELIATLLEIELLLGRDRRGEARNGPRKIDLDVLMWDDRVIESPELEVPHPRLFERLFALLPLSELVPVHQYHLDHLAGQKVEQVTDRW